MLAAEDPSTRLAKLDGPRGALGAAGSAQRILPFGVAFGTAPAHELCSRLLQDLNPKDDGDAGIFHAPLHCARQNSTDVKITGNGFGTAFYGLVDACTPGHVAAFQW